LVFVWAVVPVSLAEHAATDEGRPLPGYPDGIYRLAQQLPPAEVEALNALLAGSRTAKQIRQIVLDETGFALSEQSIRRHRLGGCSCGTR
jgi:hypothetical protein